MYKNTRKYIRTTEREREILKNLTLTNKEICEKFFLGMPSVKTYLHRLLKKFGVKNRIQLLVMALYLEEITFDEVMENVIRNK